MTMIPVNACYPTCFLAAPGASSGHGDATHPRSTGAAPSTASHPRQLEAADHGAVAPRRARRTTRGRPG
jgi:hypothetical protein